MHSDILDQVSNEKILKIFVANKPRVSEFGGRIIKAFHYFFANSKAISFEWNAIFNPFLMAQNSRMFPELFDQNFYYFYHFNDMLFLTRF